MKAADFNPKWFAVVLATVLAACQPAQKVSATKAASLADAEAQSALDASTSKATQFDSREYRVITPSPRGAFAAAAAAARPTSVVLGEESARLPPRSGVAQPGAQVMRIPQSDDVNAPKR